jgi:hypothetical protein
VLEQGSAEDLVNRMYRKLFYLPKITFLSIVYILEGFVIALSGSSSYRISPQIFVSALFGLAVYLFLIYLFFVIGGVVDTAKKSLGIAVFSLAPYILVDFIAAGKERLFLSFSASSGMVFLIHYIFKGMLFRSFGVAIATSLTASIASIYLFSQLLGQNAGKGISLSSEAPVLIISSLVSIAVFAIFIAILELGGRASGLRTFEIARGFLRSWLFGENETLERAFYRNAVRDSMRIRVLSIYRDNSKPIHPSWSGLRR